MHSKNNSKECTLFGLRMLKNGSLVRPYKSGGHGFESRSGPMGFSPVLVQNTLSFTFYVGVDGNAQYFNFGSISLSLSLSLSLYIYIYIYIYIYK